MPDDASLDDFLGGEETEVAETADDAETTPEATDDETTSPSVEPPTPTATWSSDGGPCAVCDAAVGFRWRDDDGLVCADCKEW